MKNYIFKLIEDEYSRMTADFLMYTKYQPINNIKRYKLFMENRGCSIQMFRTDQGKEYESKEINDFLMSNGILHKKTGREAHAQMLVAERMNRTLVEMARTMLVKRGLDEKWWGNEILFSTIIRNEHLCKKETLHAGMFLIEKRN